MRFLCVEITTKSNFRTRKLQRNYNLLLLAYCDKLYLIFQTKGITQMTKQISYTQGTPEEVKTVLESYLHKDVRVRLFYGNVETGEDYMEEHDITGYIGRSSGVSPCVILLNNSRSTGGLGISTRIIVKITVDNRIVYKNPNYHIPTFSVRDSNMEGYKEEVLANGNVHTRFRKPGQGQKFVAFLKGERNNY
jgi:hypothetical protein